MVCVKQHNVKTCIICPGVVWIGLPAAIMLKNYHLALTATWPTLAKWNVTTWNIHDMYTNYRKHRENLPPITIDIYAITFSIIYLRAHDP